MYKAVDFEQTLTNNGVNADENCKRRNLTPSKKMISSDSLDGLILPFILNFSRNLLKPFCCTI